MDHWDSTCNGKEGGIRKERKGSTISCSCVYKKYIKEKYQLNYNQFRNLLLSEKTGQVYIKSRLVELLL